MDGAPRTECAALLLMLAERHSERGLEIARDAAERPDYLQWMLYLANTLQPLYRSWFYTDEVAGSALAETVKEHLRPRIEQEWARVDARLRETPYLAGRSLSAVDFMATMLMRWSRNMPKPADQWSAIADYLERMKALASFRVLHDREGLELWPR